MRQLRLGDEEHGVGLFADGAEHTPREELEPVPGGALAGEGGFRVGEGPADGAFDDGRVDGILAAEVVVDEAVAQARAGRDVRDLRGGQAAFGEDRPGGAQDCLASLVADACILVPRSRHG